MHMTLFTAGVGYRYLGVYGSVSQTAESSSGLRLVLLSVMNGTVGAVVKRPVQTARVDASNQTNVKARKHSHRARRCASTNLHKLNE